MFRYFCYLAPTTDTKIFEANWLRKQLAKNELSIVPSYLNPRNYQMHFFYAGSDSLLEVVKTLEYRETICIENEDVLIENPEFIDVINHIRNNNLALYIMEEDIKYRLADDQFQWAMFRKIIKSKYLAMQKQTITSEVEKKEPEPKIKFVPIMEPKFTNDQAHSMRLRRKGGLTLQEIADEFECAISTVSRYVKDVKKGVKPERKADQLWSTSSSAKIKEFVPENSAMYHAFRNYLATFTQANTQARQRTLLRLFFKYYQEKYSKQAASPSEIMTEDISSFLVSNCEMSPKTRYLIFNSLRRFFRFCLANEHMEKDIFENISPPKTSGSTIVKSVDLDETELKRFLEYFKEQFKLSDRRRTPEMYYKNMRNFAVILLYVTTGLRSREVRLLKMKNISFDEKGVVITSNGKLRSNISTRLTPEASRLLVDYIAQYRSGSPGEHYLFSVTTYNNLPLIANSVIKMIREAAKRVGIQKHISTHSFRTTFATLATKAGMPLLQLQRRLGHSRIEQTLAYIRRSESLEENNFLPSCIKEVMDDLKATSEKRV